MKKTKVKMNKPIYLGLSILEISKTFMYEFWFGYMKPKYNGNNFIIILLFIKVFVKIVATIKIIMKTFIKNNKLL